jgi:glycosyltransferase involved in cell wall biosynthesis
VDGPNVVFIMKHKTVLFLIDTLNTGGAEKSLLEIISRFQSYRPVICHLYPGEELKPEYEAAGIQVISLNVPLPYNFRKAVKAVNLVVKDIQPTIIHSTLFRADIVSRFVAPKHKTLLVNSLVNNSYHPTRFQKASLLMRCKLKGVQLIDSLTAGRVDLFISNSQAIKTSNAIALGIPLNKIQVIHRGRNLEKFATSDAERIKVLKRTLSLEGRKVVLNVSRLLERKGQMDILDACVKVKDHHPEILFLLAGEGAFQNMLEKRINELALHNYVKILGTRQDIPDLLHAADCFVFPSYYEGLPGALIEAMMAKLPIVASDIEENLECIDEGSAFVFPVGNVDALADAINKVFLNLSEAKEKGLRAYFTSKEIFEISSIAKSYERCYSSLLSNP